MRCSSGSQSPQAGFGDDRRRPAHSGHMYCEKAEGGSGDDWGSSPPQSTQGSSSGQRRHRERAGRQTSEWRLAFSPLAPASQGAWSSAGGGAVPEVPDETFKPSWTPSLTPSPHPCWTGGLSQLQARYTKAPSSAAPKNVYPPSFLEP